MHHLDLSYNVGTRLKDLELSIPGSKSFAARLLILGSLYPREFTIINCPDCTDVVNLENSLKKIGLEISRKNGVVKILNSFPGCEKSPVGLILPGEGGTTSRFLMGLLGLGKLTYQLKLGAQISKRPMDALINTLEQCGVCIKKEKNIMVIQGPYSQNLEKVEVDCSQTTQFLSSLKLALYNQSIIFIHKNLTSSQKYLDLTDDLINKVKDDQDTFIIPTDMSTLSYVIAYAMLGRKVTVSNFNPDDLQADYKIMEIASQIGLKVFQDKNKLCLSPQKQYNKFEVDLNNCLDLAPTLSFMATLCQGTSRLKNLKQLRYKESDRLREIVNLLKIFKCNHCYHEKEDILEIGYSELMGESVEYRAPADHRMVMTAFLFMKRNAGGYIFNAKCIEKSWPEFFIEMDI
ncbi:MAG: hypothetical protein A2577_03110 [Bdellovibrionales bacterium RIFOXYD1_FULL_36_51]|nr:MAG: hypothetical protein A2417_11500 [Bdellovibrionales bacterium RIFOXYC1_FULL_37_79]OFZ62393.1 MAG: hypothetical protein A2577_03110 [Bdellovibrionales bacterium RIFOXYD1_FULL_36_51]